MQTIAELPSYRADADRWLSATEQDELRAYLALYPSAGVVMQGTGGLRKIRWGRAGMGKSGGVRVVYYFHDRRMPLYLIALFSKNEKDNLTNAEKHELAALVKQLKEYWRRHYG
jgi:hypothetical protein